MTPGAVSRQIAQLEDSFGVMLFDRRGGDRTILTARGQNLLDALRGAFGTIDRTVAAVSQPQSERRLRLAYPPSRAQQWLASRLESISQAIPRLTLTLRAQDEASWEGIDLTIRFGDGEWTDSDHELLFREAQTPVGSPALFERWDVPASEADIAPYPFLHVACGDQRNQSWEHWLTAAAVPELDPSGRLVFYSHAMASPAAMEGLGLAVADTHLVAPLLTAGRLVQPFTRTIETGRGYWLCCQPQRRHDPLVLDVKRWLMATRLPSAAVSGDAA